MADERQTKLLEWLRRADRRGRSASIVERLRRALARTPNDPLWHFELGATLCELRQNGEALHHLARAWRGAPPRRRVSVARWIAETYQQMDQTAKAVRWFGRAVALEPNDATWLILYASMWSRRGRLEEAEPLLHRATRCEEGYIDEAYLNLGLIYRAQRRYAEAEAALKTALSIAPDCREASRVLKDVQIAIKIRS